MKRSVTAFAPASIGNLGVGFDMLGLAIAGAGDRIKMTRSGTGGVSISEVYAPDGQPHPVLSRDPGANTASIAARCFWDAHGDGGGIELEIMKGVPLQSGMGGSAASAVAAVVAANALLDAPLAPSRLLPFALEGEKFASSSLHADNVAPSLLGGLVLCPPALLPDTVSLATPSGIASVLVHPDLEVSTAASRQRLARQYTMEQWLSQQGFLAGFIAACEHDDAGLIKRCLRDVVIEPQRADSVPCFPAMKAAAMDGGALGCSLSGSGPSVFALCAEADAADIAAAMVDAGNNAGVACQWWISPLETRGAHVEHSE